MFLKIECHYTNKKIHYDEFNVATSGTRRLRYTKALGRKAPSAR